MKDKVFSRIFIQVRKMLFIDFLKHKLKFVPRIVILISIKNKNRLQPWGQITFDKRRFCFKFPSEILMKRRNIVETG